MTLNLTLTELQKTERNLLDFVKRNRKRNGEKGSVTIERSVLKVDEGILYLCTWYRDREGRSGCASHSFGPVA